MLSIASINTGNKHPSNSSLDVSCGMILFSVLDTTKNPIQIASIIKNQVGPIMLVSPVMDLLHL